MKRCYDGTCHIGDGDWDEDRSKALRYATRAEAEQGLDDVDCAELLRHRLVIIDEGLL